MQPIYLDFNSTAPLLPEVASALVEAYEARYANPASQHAEGRRARRILEDAREEIARLLGANLADAAADKLVFTSGGTEANNLALFGLTAAGSAPPGRIVISAIEHPSITAAAEELLRRGWQVDRISATSDGVVRLEELDRQLESKSGKQPPRLVSIVLANNETGVLQPIEEIARRCRAKSVLVHTDATQAIGKLPVDFRALGVDAMTVSPHKFHGPRGIGALIVRSGLKISPLLHGAAQQLALRPGTESVELPLGFLAALKAWDKDRHERPGRMQALRDHFEAGVCQGYPAAIVNGAEAPRLPNTSNISFVGRDRQAFLIALDLAGICCSTGSACASGSREPSPTLLAMGLPENRTSSSLRFSIGTTTTPEEIDEAIARIRRTLNGPS
jgi:cysteine desulfurase